MTYDEWRKMVVDRWSPPSETTPKTFRERALLSVLERLIGSFSFSPPPLVLQSLQAQMGRLRRSLDREDVGQSTTLWDELLAFRFHRQMQDPRFAELCEVLRDFDRRALNEYDHLAGPIIDAMKKP